MFKETYNLKENEYSYTALKCYHNLECGFFIETEQEILVFDWFKSSLPQTSDNKPIHFFVSNAKSDGFDENLVDLINNTENLSAYLGYDNRDERVEDLLKNAGNKIREKISCFQIKQKLDMDFGCIKSFRALEGVMFLVNVRGVSLLFAGDFSIKPEKILQSGEKLFKVLTAPLKDEKVDYAMVPFDTSLGSKADLSLYHYLYVTGANIFTPTYLRGNYSYLTDFINKNPELKKKIVAINPFANDYLLSINENKPYRLNFRTRASIN